MSDEKLWVVLEARNGVLLIEESRRVLSCDEARKLGQALIEAADKSEAEDAKIKEQVRAARGR